MKNNSKQSHQSGFTLVELLMYMGIFAILLYILMQLFTAILSTHATSQATSSVIQDGNFLLSRLTYDIRRADSISVPATFGVSSQILTMSIGGANYTYQYNSANKYLTLTTGGTTYVLNDYGTTMPQAANVSFTLYGNTGGKPTVQILLTLTSTTARPGAGVETQSFETTVGTR